MVAPCQLLELMESGGIHASPAQEAYLRGVEHGPSIAESEFEAPP